MTEIHHVINETLDGRAEKRVFTRSPTAMVGLFGTLARAVAERRQELAIRAAVGASPGRLVRLVMGSSLIVSGTGLILGTTMAAATSRGLAGLLYGISPYDPATFATVAIGVSLAALPLLSFPLVGPPVWTR